MKTYLPSSIPFCLGKCHVKILEDLQPSCSQEGSVVRKQKIGKSLLELSNLPWRVPPKTPQLFDVRKIHI